MEAGERFALPSAGDVVGNWRIIRFLGEGRSGTVFEVRGLGDDPRAGALKIHLGHTRKATREEFGKEIDFVAGQLIPCRMPAFHDHGFWRGHPFFVMELAEKLPRHLPPRRLRRLIAHVARALGSLHDKGYIHCDVKPDNIGLIDGRAILLDFGSVRERKDAQSHPTRVGTWDYMAPEVRESVQLDPRADIYALGVTLGKLCDHAGRRSFESLVVRATANNPDDRPQTVEEFRRELNTAQDRLAVFKLTIVGTVLVLIAALLIMAASYLHRRADILRRIEKRREAKALIVRGLTHYQTCDFANAYINLHAGMASDEFHPEDYQGVDVKGLHDDSLRRLRETESAWPPFPSR